jgi:hemoglobin/transferrin/lactoferrin receptor protein
MYTWKKILLVHLGLVFMGWGSNAGAQERTPDAGDIADLQEETQLRSVTVTATRQEEDILDVPSTVTTITREEIEDHGVTNIQELIRHEPGVQVNRTTTGTDPFGNFPGFTIRGVGGNRVQMQVDGARVIESIQDGNRDFVDLSLMKSVEIMRGPGSVLWGADAIGGIVAYRTLDPDDLLKGRPFGAKLNTGYNSLNRAWSQTVAAGVQFSPTLQGLFGYTHRTYEEARLKKARSDGGRWGCTRVATGCDRLNPLDGEVNNVLAKFVWRPNADHEVRLTGEWFESDADIKQMYNKGIIATGRLNGDYPRTQTQTRKRTAVEHDWRVDLPWLDRLKWRLSYSPQKREWNGINYQTTVATGAPYNTSEYRDYREDFLQGDVQLMSSFEAGASSHRLTYGLQWDTTDTSYWQKRVIDNNGAITTAYGVGANFTDSTTRRTDAYIQDEIKLLDKRLTVTPGLRYATYSIDPELNAGYVIIPGKEPKKISSERLIPQVGMTLILTDVYSLYARYAEGFKMPTAQQLYVSYPMGGSAMIPNPDLDPEKVKSYETGVRGQFDDGWFSAGVFYSDYTDFIKSMQQVGVDYMSINISKVKLWGVEASGEWRFARNWAINGKLSYQHGKEKDRLDDRYIPFSGASPLTASAGLKWMLPASGLSAEVYGTFSSRAKRVSTASYDEPYKRAGYSVFDAYLNWQIDKTFRLGASVLNIFNKRYFSDLASSGSYSAGPPSANINYTNPLELQTMPGRTFGLNLTASF